MHSRIFILSNDPTSDDISKPWLYDPSLVADGVDGVVVSEDYTEDIKWLESSYNIKTQVDEEYDLCYLTPDSLNMIRSKLETQMFNRLQKIKRLIEEVEKGKADLDSDLMFQIKYEAGERIGFFFYVQEEDSLFSEFDFAGYLKSHGSHNLYIVETHDFHF